MIVVVGAPVLRPGEPGMPDEGEGLVWRIAVAAVAAGASVQIAGKVGDDAAGDALVLALGRAGVGHAAVLRDPGHPTPILALVDRDDEDAGEASEDEASLTETLLEAETGQAAALEAATPVAASDHILPADAAERPRLDAGDLELALRYLGDYRVVVVADELDPAGAEAVAAGAAYANARLVAVVPPGGLAAPAFSEATVLEAPASDPDGAFARLVAGYATSLDSGVSPEDAFRAVVEAAGWEVASA